MSPLVSFIAMTRVPWEFIKTYIFNLGKQQIVVARCHNILNALYELDFIEGQHNSLLPKDTTTNNSLNL